MPFFSQHVERDLWRFRKSVCRTWFLGAAFVLMVTCCPHKMETFFSFLFSEKLDSLLIFTPKNLRLAPFDQQPQRSLKQLCVHAMEI